MADKIDSFLDQYDPQAQGASAPTQARDTAMPSTGNSSDDPDVRRILVSIADFLTGSKGKAAVGVSDVATSKLGLPSVGSLPRGIARRPEPADANAASEAMNFAGKVGPAVGIGALTGAALGPAGAGAGALRAAAATAGREAIAGGVGELGGQAIARAAGNKNAMSAGEVALQSLLSGTFGGAARGAGELALKGIPKAQQASKGVVALAAKYGVDLTPAEIRASRALSGLESFLEKTMLGSGGINARREANADALRQAKDKLVARAGTDKERQAIGLAFFDNIRSRAEGFNNAVKETYRRAFATVPKGERVQLDSFMDTAERLASRSKRSPFGGGGAGSTGERVVDFFDDTITYHVPGRSDIAESAAGGSTRIPKTSGSGDFRQTTPVGLAGEPEELIAREGYDIYAPPAGNRAVGAGGNTADFTGAGPAPIERGLEGIPGASQSRTIKIGSRVDPMTGAKSSVSISPEDMIEIRTDLTQAVADYDAGVKLGLRTMSSRQAGAYKMLLAAIEKDMDTYAASGSAGKDFIAKYRSAKGLAKMNFEIFNNPNVVGVLKRNPEAVTSIIGRDSVTEIQALKRSVGEKGFGEIRKLWMTGLLKDEGLSTGKSLAKALSNHSDDTLREVFKSDPAALKELQEIAQLQALVGSAERNTPTVGSARAVAATGLATVGSMIGAAVGGPLGAGLGAIGASVAPYKAAQVYLSPQARKIVLEGLRAPAGSRAKAIAAARLSAFLGKAVVSHGNDNGTQRTK